MSKNESENKPDNISDESVNDKPEFTCIRKGSAPKLRDSSQRIHYEIGKSDGIDVLQLVSNTNHGLFSDELITLQSIQECLDGRSESMIFTSRIFHPLYKQKSNNNAGFLGAVLREEGILKVAEKKIFMHQLAIKPDDIAVHLVGNISDTPTDDKSDDDVKPAK